MDPVFAISVGAAAAFVRIRREEREKGHSMDQSIDALKRRTDLAWKETKLALGL